MDIGSAASGNFSQFPSEMAAYTSYSFIYLYSIRETEKKLLRLEQASALIVTLT